MENIKNFENYNNDLILEGLNFRSMLDNFKSSTNFINKKRLSRLIIMGLLSVYTVVQSVNLIENRNDLNEVDKSTLIQSLNSFKDVSRLNVSHSGLEHIKDSEGLSLKAYKLGDGMVTVGYGHAKPIGHSTYKPGQHITHETAKQLLHEDVTEASNGVKRLFNQWKEKGIDVKLTQNQYDAVVSMAFNMGIGSFRKSQFVKALKNNDMDKAAELIKITGVSKRFPGLITRRMKEYLKFIS